MTRDDNSVGGRFGSLEFPSHWLQRRAGLLFRQVSEPNNDDLPVLSVSIHNGISDRQLEDEERDRKDVCFAHGGSGCSGPLPIAVPIAVQAGS